MVQAIASYSSMVQL